ncbi:MAG: PilZ domain-containing protein [Candidatus Omnitrophota bacterium]
MKKGVERRRFPRIKDSKIGVKLSADGCETITQSLDVSASGLYCKVAQRVPLMTRVQIVLSIPSGKKGSPPTSMNIDGVVVREHPVKKGNRIEHYDVAIFFNTLLPRERERLIKYINSRTN